MKSKTKKAALEFSAGGLVYREEPLAFALIQDHNDQWTFPKGHIEKGEKSAEAALREVREELGLTNIAIVAKIERQDWWFVQEGKRIHKFTTYYLMRAEAPFALQPQWEVKGARWIPAAQALTMIGYPKTNQPVIKKALEMLRNNEIQKD